LFVIEKWMILSSMINSDLEVPDQNKRQQHRLPDAKDEADRCLSERKSD